nr:recombinase family protein [Amycolatopsis sp.]
MIYLRMSSTRQVGRGCYPEGTSIPVQRAACHRKAEQPDLTIVDEYVEPGRSATEMTRRAAFPSMCRAHSTALPMSNKFVGADSGGRLDGSASRQRLDRPDRVGLPRTAPISSSS